MEDNNTVVRKLKMEDNAVVRKLKMELTMELAHHLKSNNKSNDNTEVIDKDKGSCEQKRN